MSGFKITDWDEAYTNGVHIPFGERWPNAWIKPASDFRDQAIAQASVELDVSYGKHERARYDLFSPPSNPQGLFVFVHGGYWLKLDKSYWSHLAKGALDAGWAVAMPSYALCPDVGINTITDMVADAIAHAGDRVSGPIILSGHSAGGHLVSSMLGADSPLNEKYQSRIVHTVSISGVHDLRPLLNISINKELGLDSISAANLSPALMQPVDNCRFTAWVGGGERSEFIRQSELISNIWRGLGAWTQCVVEPDKHHFNVIDALADCESPLMKTVFDC